MREGKTKSTGPDVLSLGAGCLWGCFDPVLGQSGRASVGSISARFPVWGRRRRRLLGAFCASRRAQGMAWRRGGAGRIRRRLGFAAWESPADSRAGAGRNIVGEGGGAEGRRTGIRSSRSSFRRMAASPRARRVRFRRRAPWGFERRPESLRRIVLLGVLRLLPGFGGGRSN